MKKNKILVIMSLVIVLSFSCFLLTSCGNNESADSENNNKTDYSEMTPEELEKESIELNKSEDNFYGTWEATSDNAEMLYGHLKITINEDGTFDADVTDEVFSGTWEKIDGGIEYHSELMNGQLFYGKKCKMVIEDSEIKVTLTKVE